MSPKVSIIIVNYNGFEETIGCLKSLAKVIYPNFDIIIIDNASTNDSFEKIRDFLKNFTTENLQLTTKLLKSDLNLGFAGGCNLGIREAQTLKSDYFLLLNPDTQVEPNFLSRLIEFAIKPESHKAIKQELEKGRQLGFIGPRIFYEDKKTVYSNGGLVRCDLLQATLKDHGRIKEEIYETEPFLTDYVTGTALLVSKETVKDIGLMSEDYFMYYEDSDWAMRAKKKKYFCAIMPESIIYHKGYHSIDYLSFDYIYYLVRNGYFFAWRNGNVFQKIFAILFSGYKFLKQPIKWIIFPQKRNWIKPIILATWDFWRGKTGKISNYPAYRQAGND